MARTKKPTKLKSKKSTAKPSVKKAIRKAKIKKAAKRKVVKAKVKKVVKKKVIGAKLKKKVLSKTNPKKLPKKTIKKVVKKKVIVKVKPKRRLAGGAAGGVMTANMVITPTQVFSGPTPLTIGKNYIVDTNKDLVLDFTIKPPYTNLGVSKVYENNVLKTTKPKDFNYTVINKSDQLHVETLFQTTANFNDYPEVEYKFYNGGNLLSPVVVGKITSKSNDGNYRIDAYFDFF